LGECDYPTTAPSRLRPDHGNFAKNCGRAVQ